ncbi:hypothetical protein [uncultured Alloprevotella sp.]|uniref:hypothetical protein n=1 Tax=uncultured Alloprevotella sp. TaxID=1283315 RepID=UPI00261A8B78|nr:hypothetical protein [uncultured Alloprevotella sp.]
MSKSRSFLTFSANCNDLSVIDGVEGKVSYYHSTKTLTLENATIKTSDKVAISISQAMNIKGGRKV